MPPPHNTQRSAFEYLFDPDTIAVIGASSDTLKPGGRLFKTIKEHRFDGLLWPVNPNAAEVMSIPAYPSVAALPAAPDLAIVAIPAAHVLYAVEALAAKGARATIILTSGFGEKDARGKAAEEALGQIARAAGMTLIGPNCSGFLTKRYKGKFAGMVPQVPGAAVDFISGSGATVDYLMEQAVQRGLSFGNVVNLGNSVMVGVEDLLAMYDAHYARFGARVLLLYLESIRKPQLLLQHARSLYAKGCRIVAIKAGTTAAGERAAASHTGALANPDAAVTALLAKAGVIRVASRAALIDVACVLVAGRGRPIHGRRAAIVTDAGGPGVMLADELNRRGWEVPILDAATRRRLAAVLPPEGSTLNPIDYLPSRTPSMVRQVLQILAAAPRDRLDVLVVITGDPGLGAIGLVYDEILRAMDHAPLPVLPVIVSITSSRAAIVRFIDQGGVFFLDEVALGAALSEVAAAPAPDTVTPLAPWYDRSAVATALKESHGVLPPPRVQAVLRAAGWRLPPQVTINSSAELAAGCRRIGFPLAMKVSGPLHKSDVGGVRLGIADFDTAHSAWQALVRLPGAQGVTLQPMIDGHEVILGAARQGDFGCLIMFGLGGIHTEVLQDVRFALAPLTTEAARAMIRGIRAYPIIQGLRGQPGLALDLLADQLVRLGRLVTDFPQISEIDLNPVKGYGEALYVVDARIIVRPPL